MSETLARIGDKWSVLFVLLLRDGTQRFGELKRLVPGISQRMLTLTLRGLERDGLVARTYHTTMPPRVDYELTALGHSLSKPIPSPTDLATGSGHTCALLAGGTVRCWGANSSGQVGTADTTSPVTTPTAVQGITGAVAIAAGGATTCAMLSNGSVQCWGHVIGTDSLDYALPTTVW